MFLSVSMISTAISEQKARTFILPQYVVLMPEWAPQPQCYIQSVKGFT